MPEIVDVQHECAEGWHKFTSPQVPGFYLLAEQGDLEEVYDEIPQAIAALIFADFGIDVRLTAHKRYSDYLEELPEDYRPDLSHYVIEKLAA
jgi:hypothetical protein